MACNHRELYCMGHCAQCGDEVENIVWNQDEEITRLKQREAAQASRIKTLEQLVTDAMEDDTEFKTEWDTAAQAYFDAQQEGSDG